MKIAIDTTPISKDSGHRVRGSGTYVNELINSLEKHVELITNPDNFPKADILHIPYFEPFSKPQYPSHKRTVFTVHDLIPLKFPNHFPAGIKGKIHWNLQKHVLKSANAVITDSQASKNDIHTFTKINTNKIHSIPLASSAIYKRQKISQNTLKRLKKRHNLPDTFALYVGDVTWNKNLPNIIQASIQAEIPLVLVGKALAEKSFDKKNKWNQDLLKSQKLIEKEKSVNALGYVASEDLALLYNLAFCLVMPSRYEGFGLPVLEAMQSGLPVVTSKCGSIPEVVADSALFADPNNPGMIADQIIKLKNEKINEIYSKKGLNQAKKYSWRNTANLTIIVYEKIIGNFK